MICWLCRGRVDGVDGGGDDDSRVGGKCDRRNKWIVIYYYSKINIVRTHSALFYFWNGRWWSWLMTIICAFGIQMCSFSSIWWESGWMGDDNSFKLWKYIIVEFKSECKDVFHLESKSIICVCRVFEKKRNTFSRWNGNNIFRTNVM